MAGFALHILFLYLMSLDIQLQVLHGLEAFRNMARRPPAQHASSGLRCITALSTTEGRPDSSESRWLGVTVGAWRARTCSII